ncbi:hypothetical protein INT43_000913 [Umbelopsis isabellina]|uniref:Uncharacterized protein n=1 Tax=Mortierella isabellina TaxID=91625 RepID=A0A8H7UJ34_MORIS|nr:hypothetical protein INT43_000913 [Umbelopsis isabellina]
MQHIEPPLTHSTAVYSNIHYVGYVEDEESVEAIMKKFEELDRIQKEFSSISVTANPSNNSEGKDSEMDSTDTPRIDDTVEPPQGLTEAQLQEVFKQTSSFTVRSAMMNSDDMDGLDDVEIWQLQYQDGLTDEIYEEDDYIHLDLEDDDFWDREFGEARHKKRLRRVPAPIREKVPGGRRGIDRESIIAKYKIMQVRVQDRNGNYFMVKKKVSAIDPSLPTYVKIPGEPIPRSWVHTILNMPSPSDSVISSIGQKYCKKNILNMDLTELGTNFQAIYMDPPLLLPGEEPTPGKISIEQLASLDIPSIVPKGFLFIWLEKEWLPDIVRMCEKWQFKYVENFCWIKKNLNNQIAKKPYTYFNKSKLSLLIFRREGDVELRHQRNPDCVFDFSKPQVPGELTELKPRFLYQIIETLLPSAIFHPENNPNGERLLELWAKADQKRLGWTTVVDDLSL